ncbi:MAG: methyltransferase domain-containing protein [Bacteroidota bacterium]
MGTIIADYPSGLKKKAEKEKTNLVEFYDEATEDYEFWSKDFNMHFGYYIPFRTNIFRRDSMLNEMNSQVLKRLGLTEKKTVIADLGCGMGGTMRYALKKRKQWSAMGVTLSEEQVKNGNRFLKDHAGAIVNANYNHTSFKSNSFNGAVAIESFCHSGHNSKSFAEAFRILKPNGRLVVADAFLKKEPEKLCIGSHFGYKQLCNSWSLERLGSIHQVVAEMKNIGFKDIRVEDISFRVAPSVLHVPFAIVGFALRKLVKNGYLKRQSINNLKGSFFALLCGLHLKSFGYYLITGTKSEKEK